MRHALHRARLTVALILTLAISASAHAQERAVPTDEELLAMMSERPELETGTGIVGRVVDGTTGDAIIEGAVVVVELDRRVYTNLDGYFAVDVPPGTYTLRSFYELFQPTRVSGVVVAQGRATEVEIALEPDTSSVAEELVVTARAETGTAATQLQVRRQASGVRDAISAEEISRSPDSAASDAARRVVAATVVGGRYLYVRGLGGRYTNVLLNGAQIPQLDPDVPGVQLDMFPANLLSSMSILKTYGADLPGSFGGGTMLLETRSFPDDFEAGASISLGYQNGGTLGNGLGYRGGGLDWIGFDDGARALPSGVARNRLAPPDLASDEITELSRTFPNRWAVERETVLPAIKVGFDVGDTVTLGDRFIGYVLAVGYSRSPSSVSDEVIRELLNSGMGVQSEFARDSTTTTVNLSALGSATLELHEGQELTLTTLFNQSADDYAAFQLGHDGERDATLAKRRLRWVQRTMWLTQLSGDHRDVFESSRLRWRVNTAIGRRYEPDTRDLIYRLGDDGLFVWEDRNPQDGIRLYSDLDQLDVGGGAHLESPLLGATAKVGGAFNLSDREYGIRRFELNQVRRVMDPAVYQLAPEHLFRPENADVFYQMREVTLDVDGYAASQDLYAAFATLEVPLSTWLRAAVGVRAESFRQVLEPRSPFAMQTTAAEEGAVARTDVDVLPAGSLVLDLAEDMYVRAAYSATVARPQIRELSTSVYPDFVRNRVVFGDPTLQRTLIQNFDLRWEMFPSEDEVVAASVFAKLFDQPIELVILDANYTVSYQNIERARNYGAEIEARLSLGRLSQAIDAFSIGGNLTLVSSAAKLNEEQARVATSSDRPLAGQSPYVANLSLGFAPSDARFQAFVYYNVFGRRIEEVGANTMPDTYQRPFHSLDFVFQWDIDDHFRLKGAVENLLFDAYELRQGGVTVRRYEPGLSASVQLGWSG